VGAPPMQFNVLIDTGSSNLALPAIDCDSSCNNTRMLYNPHASDTAQIVSFAEHRCQVCGTGHDSRDCEFGQAYPALVDASRCGYGLSYGGGSSYIAGYVVDEQVTFGAYTVRNMIIPITTQVPTGAFTAAPVNGILGLAQEHNACNPTYTPTIFSRIIHDNPSLPDLFATCLDPLNGGTLDIGWVDLAKFTGPLVWLPIMQPRWYNLPLLDVRVGERSVGVPAFAYSYVNDQIGSFIDSGTQQLLLGPAAFQGLQSIFQTYYCQLPGVCGPSSFFTGLCVTDAQMAGHLSQFPPLHFVFQTVDGSRTVLSVPGGAYLLHSNGQFCFGIVSVQGIGAVLGDIFMSPFYIVHDRAHARIGFATVTRCM